MTSSTIQLPHRWVVRLLVISLIPIGITLCLELFGSKELIDLLESGHSKWGLFIGAMGAFAALTYFSLWLLMLLHWKGHEFATKRQKRTWLLVLLVLTFLGALWYYFKIVIRHPAINLSSWRGTMGRPVGVGMLGWLLVWCGGLSFLTLPMYWFLASLGVISGHGVSAEESMLDLLPFAGLTGGVAAIAGFGLLKLRAWGRWLALLFLSMYAVWGTMYTMRMIQLLDGHNIAGPAWAFWIFMLMLLGLCAYYLNRANIKEAFQHLKSSPSE